ncbi:MAG TPA: flavin prenyltransferase UbiX [Blastocatellia bacterium]|nr:flavin prenyltransferase UbiX [Blastocatellia bacterium]HMV84698.1 flavin prenyltransferase UbiX [Blastocatellia bacterium]HMX25379.1 flavin prenyltransferase UbiX [Blastocatellia bacterium]HMY74144.1 flavin prenyltransferase UbiX [Blastocatellia bacterium]HMZ21352.1 flavin prenyltransferase UbiX [Blastocatellia bacterium]
MKNITVGITGASGSIYAQRLLAQLNENHEVARIDLVISQAGVRVVGEELGLKVAGTDARVVRELLGPNYRGDSDKVKVHSANDIGATVASGSYLSDAMIVVPCSMSSLAAIASGMSRDLVHRAADVMMKEQRTLILVPRETPLNAIHLENMLKLARLGVRIIPAMPSFYHFPKTIDDLVEHFTHRLLDHLGVGHEQKTRWEGSRKTVRQGDGEIGR